MDQSTVKKLNLPHTFTLAIFDDMFRQVVEEGWNNLEKMFQDYRGRVYSWTNPKTGEVQYRVQIEFGLGKPRQD